MVAVFLRCRKPDTCHVTVEERDLLLPETYGRQNDFGGGLQFLHQCGLVEAKAFRLVPMPNDGGRLTARQIAPILRRIVFLPVDARPPQRILRQDAASRIRRRHLTFFKRKNQIILRIVSELDQIRDIVLEKRPLCGCPSDILSVQ